MADILVVEDDYLFRQSLENLLSEFGHRIESAESADEALQKSRERTFELVLCDVRISGETDGVEALSQIRQLQPDIRCIVMTGFSDVQAPVRAASLHADDYLLKPFRLGALVQAIQTVLNFESSSPGFLTRLTAAPSQAAHKALSWLYDSQLQQLQEQREKSVRKFFVLVRSKRLNCSDALAFFALWEQLELDYLTNKLPQRWGELLAAYRTWGKRLLDLDVPAQASGTIERAAFERLYARIQAGVIGLEHLLKAVQLLHMPEARKASLEDFCAYHWLWAGAGEGGDPFLGIAIEGYRLVRQHSGGDSQARLYEAEAEHLPDSGDRVLCLPATGESQESVKRELAGGRVTLLATVHGHHFLLYPSYAISLKSRLAGHALHPKQAWNLLRPVFVQVAAFHRQGKVSGSFSLRDIDWPPNQQCTLTVFNDTAYREAHASLQTGGHIAELSAAPEVLEQPRPTPASDQAVLGRLLFEAIFGGRYPSTSLRTHMRMLGKHESNQAFAPYVERLGPLRQVFYRLAHSDPLQRFGNVDEAISAADAAFPAT
jgi:CheY-like chemotaxis protein